MPRAIQLHSCEHIFTPPLAIQCCATSLSVETAMSENTKHWRKSGLPIDLGDSAACKFDGDKVDVVLTKDYDFTGIELDSIVTYDITYRMGLRTEEDTA